MINPIKICRTTLLALLLGVLPDPALAEIFSKEGVTIVYDNLGDGTIKVKYAENKSSRRIMVYVDGTETTINAGGSAQINQVATRKVNFNYKESNGPVLWRYTAPATTQEVEETPSEAEPEEIAPTSSPVVGKKKDKSVTTHRHTDKGGYPSAIEQLNQDSFFGTEAVATYVRKADSYANGLSISDNKAQFLIDNDIDRFLSDSESELTARKEEIPAIALGIVVGSRITDPASQEAILSSVIELLNNRVSQRETAFVNLKNAVGTISTDSGGTHSLKGPILNYSVIGIIFLVLLIWVTVAIRKKKVKAKSKPQAVSIQQPHDADPDNPMIVVRRRTTSILKRQSIDDVIGNPEYLLINTSEFVTDSAVRNIYIKNTCIKEVYNLYAEDLRNSDNPKEDGCMVLGRWVHDEETDTYDISLETVVFPGDDAVFKEYELNFGGKIKLRIAEKLRKLRRETNLQYDLVCWIHSHPGLGVFFSNSDNNVQMQLKHSRHPNFLVAFVVDILTSDQEMGIFTFRKDGSMNSKGDLTKLYSLEEMYRKALESDTASFNPDNYHDILGSARMQLPTCKGIGLNNSSIIDLTQIVIEPATGIAGWAVGTSVDVDGGKQYAVSGIVKAEEKPTTGVIGVLLNVTHMSLPTIQRLIVNENPNPSFVMVYSSRQNTLTSIPVINGDLLTDDHFYGEETIDDLKIWTRRKR